MDLKTYLNGKDRAEFAKVVGTTKNYINNLCQRPFLCGKVTALRISEATGGQVTVMELLFPDKKRERPPKS